MNEKEPKNIEVNCFCCGATVVTGLDVVEKTSICIKCRDVFARIQEKENIKLKEEIKELKYKLTNSCSIIDKVEKENAKLKEELTTATKFNDNIVYLHSMIDELQDENVIVKNQNMKLKEELAISDNALASACADLHAERLYSFDFQTVDHRIATYKEEARKK